MSDEFTERILTAKQGTTSISLFMVGIGSQIDTDFVFELPVYNDATGNLIDWLPIFHFLTSLSNADNVFFFIACTIASQFSIRNSNFAPP